jgi:hypothetical protein
MFINAVITFIDITDFWVAKPCDLVGTNYSEGLHVSVEPLAARIFAPFLLWN